MARYRVTFEIEVEPEDSGHFQPGSRDASIVGTDMHAVGASDLEAVRMLVMFAFQGLYPWEKWKAQQFGSTSLPPCVIERVSEPEGEE